MHTISKDFGKQMVYVFGDFELDTSTLELRENGNYVHLEPQVFGVLNWWGRRRSEPST